jgi:RNA polymerase sigma-70 factor (ECF subfamily)
MPGEDQEPLFEADLVRRARAGDESAVQALFDRHVDALRRRVQRGLPVIARRKVAGSDVIQEAYLAAFLRLADFEDRGDGSFGKWLSGILDNKIRDEVRRYLGTTKRAAWREEALPVVGEDVALPSRQRTPGSEAAAAEERARLRRCMDLLAPADREILDLVHREGLKFTEAAERLGTTPDAARMRHARALSRVTELMTKGDAKGNTAS